MSDTTPDMRRGTTIDLWEEVDGYWSAKVSVRIPGHAEWLESATSFHDPDEAHEWALGRIQLAVDSVS